MIHLFLLLVVNSLTVFALFILLVRSLWSLLFNITTIESWEIERHDTLVRRARTLGGYLEGPGGVKVRIKRQEFPYDIGLFSNIGQGMGGTMNVSAPSHPTRNNSINARPRLSAGSRHLRRPPIVEVDGSSRPMTSKV